MKPRVCITILAGAILSLVACARGPQHYIEVGNRYFKEKRYTEAALSYRNAIQKDTNSVDAYYGFALTQIAQQEVRPAIATLRMVLRLKPDHEPATISLGDILLQILLGDERRPKPAYDQLAQLADKLLARDQNSFDGLRFRGHLAVFDGKSSVALELLSRADSIRPGQPRLQLALADAMVRNNLHREAEQLALAIIEKDKSFGSAYDFLQYQYLKAKRSADADLIMLRKAESNPLVADFQVQLAGYYLVSNRLEKAEPVLQRLQSDSKNFPDAHLRIGDLYVQLGKDSDAQRQFEEGLRTDSARANVYRKRLAPRYWKANRKSEALQMAAVLVKADPNDDEALRLRASFLLEEGKQEHLQQVIADYTGLDSRNSRDAVISYQLGRAYRLKGSTQQASAQFEEAIKRNQGYVAPRLAVAEIKAAQGRYEDALHQLDQVLALDSANGSVRLLRAATLRNLKRYPEARMELMRLLGGAAANVDGQVELGLLNLAEGHLTEAELIFRKLHQANGTDRRPAAGLVRVYSAQQRYAKAIDLLSEEIKRDPASDEVRQTLKDVAIRAGNVPLALEQLNQIVARNPQNALAYVQIGQLQMDRGNVTDGLASLRKAVELAPKDANVLLAFSVGLQEAGNFPGATAGYRRLLAEDAQNSIALNNLAYLLAESGSNLDEALIMAKTAAQKQPSNRSFLDTLGLVYLKKDMVGSASEIFRSLASAEPNNPTFRMHLAMTLIRKGDRPNARKELLAALRIRNSPEQEKRIRGLLATTSSDQ